MNCKLCPVGTERPECVMQLVDSCILEQNRTHQDWTHITTKEHVCAECINFLSAETGVDNYSEFVSQWNPDAYNPATVMTFITEKLLPYWLKCKKCQKWRKLQNSHLKEANLIERDLGEKDQAFVRNFTCSDGHLRTETVEKEKNGNFIKVKRTKLSHSCDVEEEEEVRSLGLQFIHSLSYAPLLKFSPVENLISGYYPDGVGQSVTDSAKKTEYVEHDDDSRGATPKKRTPQNLSKSFFSDTKNEKRFGEWKSAILWGKSTY